MSESRPPDHIFIQRQMETVCAVAGCEHPPHDDTANECVICGTIAVGAFPLCGEHATRPSDAASPDAFFAVERPYIPGANAEDLKAYELAVQRLRIAYDIEQGRREPCPVPSSVTGRSCLLYDGHPQDSPTRFHRYRYEDVFIPAARYLANSPPRTITCPDCGDVLATDEWAGHRLSEGTEVNPSVSEWIEHGLAAAEDLSAAYHEVRDGPGGLNVGTMRAHIDAITAAFEAIRNASLTDAGFTRNDE